MSKRERRFIPISNQKMARKLWTDEILYIIHRSRRTDFITGDNSYYMYCPVKSIEIYLDENFYKCSKNLIINLEKVLAVEHFEVQFEDGSRLQLSRNEYVPTKQVYAGFLIKKTM